MRKAIVVLSFLLVPAPASAWGFEAHKFIAERVIALLPPEIRPYFKKHGGEFAERAIDPDLWRTASYANLESPHHFVDMDAYGPYPFEALPHDRDEAIKKHGAEFVTKNGTLPWRTEEMYAKLVDAFTQKSGYARDNIKFYAAWIAHYISDAHVPFHATLNHDGQLTAQWGIHARFESELFERYRAQLKVTPGAVVPVKSPREFAFDTLLASFRHVQPVLDADKEAVKGRELYDDEYFAMLFAKVQPILETRLADSITGAASLITAAWIEAGRPAVPLTSPRVPRKVRRQ